MEETKQERPLQDKTEKGILDIIQEITDMFTRMAERNKELLKKLKERRNSREKYDT